MAVLGSMLIERDALERACEIVQEEHFYSAAHRLIYCAMRALYDKSRAVDLITLTEELKRSGKLEEAGGEVYLSELIEKVSTAAHVTHYADIVRLKSTMRDLINAATGIVESCYREDSEPDELVDKAQEKIFSVGQKQLLKGFTDAGSLSQIVMERIEAAHRKKETITGVATGFKRFDEMTGGLQPSDFIILAARPSQGKTAMALNMAYHACVEKNVPTAFFSLEMNKYSVMQRLICSAARADLSGVRNGRLAREIWPQLTRYTGEVSRAPLYIDDSPGLTILEVRNRTRKLMTQLKAENKSLGLIIVDYLQLIRGAGRSESRQQEVSEISRLLKDLARSLEVPVMALSQLNRRSEDKAREGNRPQLSDLRDSGSIEQDADVVALIHRPEYYNRTDPTLTNKATLIIAKQRNGPVGDVELAFFHKYTKFENPAVSEMEPAAEEAVF